MDDVDRHGLRKLCEIFRRQLDVARRTVLEGTSGISVYKTEEQSVRS